MPGFFFFFFSDHYSEPFSCLAFILLFGCYVYEASETLSVGSNSYLARLLYCCSWISMLKDGECWKRRIYAHDFRVGEYRTKLREAYFYIRWTIFASFFKFFYTKVQVRILSTMNHNLFLLSFNTLSHEVASWCF